MTDVCGHLPVLLWMVHSSQHHLQGYVSCAYGRWHACLLDWSGVLLGQGALQIHLYDWTVARIVGERLSACAILPDMTHSACCCCLLYHV